MVDNSEDVWVRRFIVRASRIAGRRQSALSSLVGAVIVQFVPAGENGTNRPRIPSPEWTRTLERWPLLVDVFNHVVCVTMTGYFTLYAEVEI